jgi:hypothetical protein
MQLKQPQEPCTLGCGEITSERHRYFTGKYMTARDFRDEQAYFLSHHRLHNRLLHGWGIVCGLRVVHHPRADCRDRWVVVRAGIAIDCCGRELVLRRDTPFELPLSRPPETGEEDEPGQEGTPYQQHNQQRDDMPQQHDRPEQAGMTEPFLLCLRYVEKPIEYVPALYAEGTCDPKRREANRVREVACLDICRLDDVEPDCWKVPGGDPHTACRDDCDDELPGPAGSCLEPDCPCGETVPLALIIPKGYTHPAGAGPGEVTPEGERPEEETPSEGYTSGGDTPSQGEPGYEVGFDIDTRGRRHLPVPVEYLTHIVGINWPHGGELTLSELRDRDGQLRVSFDRKLLPAEGDATGINLYTFVVQYGGAQQDIEFLPFDQEHEPTLEEDCVAVFTIDPDYLRGRRTTIANSTVYVTLKCDFILDCHENPVDGDHLRGRLPSGNGVPGGVFESWFRVVPDGRAREEA